MSAGEGTPGTEPAEAGQGSEQGGSGSGEQGTTQAEPGSEPGSAAGGDAGGAGGEAGSWAPSIDDLASMPDGMDEVLRLVASSAEAMAEVGGTPGEKQKLEAVRSDAEQLVKSLTGMREMVGAVRKSVNAAQMAADGGVDDDAYGLESDPDEYYRIQTQIRAEASVLSRRLNQVLAENRADRLASVQYRSGQRLSMPGLMRAVADSNHDSVYRRKGRSRNRKYAFAILGDVSGSMRGDKIAQMAYTSILGAEAIAQTDGCELAVYAFAENCVLLKPFDLSLEIRGGYLGDIGTLAEPGSRVGRGATNLGAAVERAGADMLARYDDSWRRVIMVVTDGMPSDSLAAEHNIRSLVRHDGFDMFGIGIKTQGQLAKLFPHWIRIEDAWELSPALMRMMRKAVVRG